MFSFFIYFFSAGKGREGRGLEGRRKRRRRRGPLYSDTAEAVVWIFMRALFESKDSRRYVKGPSLG